jgi:hypothetical protein
MDYVLHNPEPSTSQHQGAQSSCPYLNRSEIGPHSTPPRPTSYYDPVHGPAGPWVSPPLYQWSHPPPGHLLHSHPHSHPHSGPGVSPSDPHFFPGPPIPSIHQTLPSMSGYPGGHPFINSFGGGPDHSSSYRSPSHMQRMSGPPGPSPSSNQPSTPPQPQHPSQNTWNSRPFGGMSPPSPQRYSPPHPTYSRADSHPLYMRSFDGSGPASSSSLHYQPPYIPEPSHGPGIFSGAPFPVPSPRQEPVSPPRSGPTFGGALRPGQSMDGPTSPGMWRGDRNETLSLDTSLCYKV